MTQFDKAKDLIDAIEAYASATADEAVAGNDMEGTRSGDAERMTENQPAASRRASALADRRAFPWL